MKQDLSQQMGYKVIFDPETLEVETDERFSFRLEHRKAKALMDVLIDPESVDPEEVLYTVHWAKESPPERKKKLKLFDLAGDGFLIIPPRRIGREYIKTRGHYHPPIPGTKYGFPELFGCAYGEILILMQHRNPSNLDELDDVVLVKLTPGFQIVNPPGYSHIFINATQQPWFGTDGLVATTFKPVPDAITERKGAAYYIVVDGDGYKIEPNPNYKNAPPIRHIDSNTDLQGTPFEPPYPGVPVWKTYQEHPEDYAWLSQADAVEKRFKKWFKESSL